MKINGSHSDLLNQKPGVWGPAFCVGTNLQVPLLCDKAWEKTTVLVPRFSIWPHIRTPGEHLEDAWVQPGTWPFAGTHLLCSPYSSQAIIAGVLQSLVSFGPVGAVMVAREDSGFGIR